ncbi:hypothetical protein [Rheinheimera hassiensis]|uniref:hypothetical protein n=1 Tax=Rheinheimera hassiensis TaxID=1193627 RepID=UPI001F06733D|nr:hypothetical protein [Rheinheimera hassiensis]
MRSLVLELVSIYGVQHNAQITNWVNEQMFRETSVNGVSISLVDVDEDRVIGSVKKVIAELSLTLNQLVNGTWLVASLGTLQQSFDATIELRPYIFKELLLKSLKIASEGFIRDGDVHERYLEDSHILHIASKSAKSAPILYAYLNGTIAQSGAKPFEFSCSMSDQELNGVITSYIDSKFNGVNPFSDEQWRDIFLASVYRRIYDKGVFTVISRDMSSEDVAIYGKLAGYGHERFATVKSDDDVIYCSYGRKIGKKMVRYNALEVKSECGTKPQPTLKLVVNKPAKVIPVCDISPAIGQPDVQNEWGEF